MDDPTARIVCEISAEGKTNLVSGLVERDGKFWLENTPLQGERNLLVLTAVDAAGNVSHTNLTVYKSHDLLIMDPVPPAELNNSTVTVTGKVSPPDSDIWVNDVKGTVHTDGTWVVYKVPPGEGGTAVLHAHAAPRTAGPPAVSPGGKPETVQNPGELVFVQTPLGTSALTLNAQQPSCGAFKLHLIGTAGRSFVLLASTNLVEWTPLSTNSTLGPSFDFTDTTTTNYPCRFYRVLPIP